jgi:hypothetical protein
MRRYKVKKVTDCFHEEMERIQLHEWDEEREATGNNSVLYL